ncbi:hypothetical protein T484DRAFT_1976944 [Baffinella frigidus]|nr:hypothetical protein T484DRAFT_1976944 [Cryptophyta sp. CCMP2293]
MAGFTACLAVAFGTALDNLAVGASYGLQGRRVRTSANMLIAGSNSGTTAVTMVAGEAITRLLSVYAASLFGASIFLVLGLIDLRDAWNQRNGDTTKAEKGKDGDNDGAKGGKAPVGLTEIGPVALGLCATNIAGGIAAGAAGMSLSLSTLLSFICSFVLFRAGTEAAGRASSLLQPQQISLVSGSLLFVLGLTQLPSSG